MADALAMGIGFSLVLIMVGGVREVLGSGTLFAHASLFTRRSFRLVRNRRNTAFPRYFVSHFTARCFFNPGF